MDTKTPLHSQYKDSFFRSRHKLSWRVPYVCQAIADSIKFTSIVDVGCANGDIVQGFADMGFFSYGVEGSPHAKPHLMCDPDVVHFHDLREQMYSDIWCELCTCLEVAEHIETEFVPQFITNLTTMSDQLLLSIAGPGQGGTHHYTLKHIGWWDCCFRDCGFIRDDSIAERIIKQWEPHKNRPGIKAYYQNLHFYTSMKYYANGGNHD